MKITVFLFAIVLSSIASAQTQVSTGKASNNESILKGAYIGLDYMNLTDLKATKKESNVPVTGLDSEGGMSLGLAGIRLGYQKQIGRSAFNVGGGARYSESFNENEGGRGSDKAQLLVIESNGQYELNSLFAGYVGWNYSDFIGPSKLADYLSGGVGLQIGFIVSPAKHFSFNAGYTMLNQELTMESGTSKVVANMRFSGFTSSLNYVF